jgi:hypothetical protein
LKRAIDDVRPRHPQDPRNHPRYRPRGGRRFPNGPRAPGWTYEQVAAAANRTVKAVKKAYAEGRVDMRELASVAAYIVEAGNRDARATVRAGTQ